MANYQGSCTGAMLDKAGEMAMKYQSIEVGRVELTEAGGKTIEFKNVHQNPRIFLQLNFNTDVPNPTWSVQPLASRITDTSFFLVLEPTDTHDNGMTKTVPKGTYYVDYFVIDE